MTEQTLKAIIKHCTYSYGLSPYDELFVDIDSFLEETYNLTIDYFVNTVFRDITSNIVNWQNNDRLTINTIKDFVKKRLYEIGNLGKNKNFIELYHDTSDDFSRLMQNLYVYWLECKDEKSVQIDMHFKHKSGAFQDKRIVWENNCDSN